ncbi:signal-induced proliferation-associated 1-like protein 2 [Scyliorhinus canicula]|uniref:signal-induced proliferation-associated 1-like protein 2 n=1 Tax=Scyliorhinus canicula TaxID=7830 RepID=UPI0018F5A85D|nr:signal-induced proliferation-associated 1-like protein 2 [Scyliorhinus canicula]XP_038656430.1 signal-induced proliferation-associated 1-like protein 2 [Scyliorhinus canicula]XP_038656431.1 signal-induced proliferation-associated 1-like protein 2 [Scyliorhinus canicula]XP_038656432.1 signal-induced proliferation-associated 1-like protein 2 [Scyliorhinus canicula]XP_038656433.1 signal-induced proliferation-associated 1-like protein 2 [Scyliorhinus canicula]XP_038656434.1 signal-induced proli
MDMSDKNLVHEEQPHSSGASGFSTESARSMQSDDIFARKYKVINGNMGPPIPSGTPCKSDNSSQVNGTPAMPKMGVRARISEWPPKKEFLKEGAISNLMTWDSRSLASYDTVSMMRASQNGQNEQSIEGLPEENPDITEDLDFADARYVFGDLFTRSPQRGLHPIRQRSNSDVTISDIDSEDILDQNAVNPNTGAALHREYGSTSSIDRQGITGDSFFAMLRGYRSESEDQRSPGPLGLSDLLRCDSGMSPSLQAATHISRAEFVRISGFDYVDSPLFFCKDRDKSFKRRLKPEMIEASLFRKLRTAKSEHEALKFSFEQEENRLEKSNQLWMCHKCFAHYDVQSILFNVNEAMANRANVGQRKNTTTGASAASQHPTPGGYSANCESPTGSKEELNSKESLDSDEGDGKSNNLTLACPYFRNEIGGEGERRIALSRANSCSFTCSESCSFESSLSSHCTNAGVSVLEVPRENQAIHREKVKRYIIEHIDLGAYYYRKYFYGKEHQNYFGTDESLGPVAVSIRREKLDESKEKDGLQYNYRVAFRTSELSTLRGAVLEDAVPSTARHGTARGLPMKEVLEYVIPEVNIQCLRVASNSPKVLEQLLKLDEQGLSFQHKVGVLYCKAGQSTEEEMYNNENGGPVFEEFLDLLGHRVRLKGFSKYKAQLDNKADSTGTHSLYTTYKDYEIMFHVSTMLPYTPNNRQQLLRKRHIGNDIVTIVFQEPGALPFTPRNIRSHFQHVFVIVRVHNPCTENVCYSVAVSRSKDVPPFGPPIPKGVTFPKSAVFRDFLLAKVINAENAAHKSEKFRAMATRTRQEYLKDLAENFVTTATVDASVKFSFITLGAKKKEKSKPRKDAQLYSFGAIVWNVITRDFGQSNDIECLLGISNEFIVLVEQDSKNVVFNCSCRDVIGWTSGLMTIKIFYERGECILLSAMESCADDIREIVQRLELVTRGCETAEMTLRRNGLGQLGFHVNFEGIVADVEPFGYAWKAGLRQGSRLVEICKVAVATLTHEQMIDLLRTSVAVKVVIIQPHEDGSPRRGCSELYRIPMVEYKVDNEGTPCEFKTPFRRNTTWHRVATPAGQPLSRCSPIQGAADRLQSQQMLQQVRAAIPRSTSFDRKLPDGVRTMQDVENAQLSQSNVGDASQHYRNSPSNQSSSSDPGPSGSSHWRQQSGYDGCQSPVLHDHQGSTSALTEYDGPRERDGTLERTRSVEARWHVPSTKMLNSYKGLQREPIGKESPNKILHITDNNCSSHSSSNTLSSNASSNSDDKQFGSGDLMDPELLGLTYIKGASTDSGIDTAPCIPPPLMGTVHLTGNRSAVQSRAEQMVQWVDHSEDGGPEDGQAKSYTVHNYAAAISASHATQGSTGDLSEISSHSSGSHHSGSPSPRVSKASGSLDASKVYILSQNSPQVLGSMPGSYHCQGAINKYVIGWKKLDGSPTLEESEMADCRRTLYGDITEISSSNQHQALSQDLNPVSKSQQTFTKEEFLKLMLPDSPPLEQRRRKISVSGNLSPRKSLYRTLSDESICSNRRGSSYNSSRSSMLEQALPNDILFSTTPPYHCTLPPRATLSPCATGLRTEFWFSDGSLVDKSRFTDPGLMPLPDTASGLDWSNLVDAARAFEDQRVTSFCTLNDMRSAQSMEGAEELSLHIGQTDRKDHSDDTGGNSANTITGKVNQLETILIQLQDDLRKEKEDKAMLQAEVHHLRHDNLRLQEESQTAAAQLRKFTEWFFNTIDKKS